MPVSALRRLLHAVVVAACVMAPGPASAASILFARVGSTTYVADGQNLVNFQTTAGHTVSYVDLNTTVVTDFSPYSQVWVYDLVTGANNSANQMANYQNIANWYNGLADKNLITDGRIISSAGTLWGNEPAWIQNYAAQLEGAGGGMVLGTDHDAYQGGINTINALININPFTGFFFQPPYEAVVDPLSPLYVASLPACTSDPLQQCIDDSSSTGFVPTGLQPNGQFLTPVAYHGTLSTAFSNAAVSTTFASPTFPVPEPTTLVLLGSGLLLARRRLRQRNGL